MNRFLAFMISISLLLSLCSCARKSEAEPQEPQKPQSVPELESIVEPVTGEEEPAVSESPESESTRPAAKPGSSAASEDEPTPESSPSSKSSPAPKNNPVPQNHAIEQTAQENEPPVSGPLSAISPGKRYNSEAIEKELLRLINSLRDEAGVNALGIEDEMQFAARIRSAEALESFSHTRTDGTPYNTAFDEAGFSYAGKWHGENLSYVCFSAGMLNENEIALEMFNNLKSSPGHYRNMVEKNFVQAGIGVAVNYNESIVDITSAQMFSSL